MSLLLDALYALGLIVSSPIWLYRLLRTGKWRTDWSARFGHVAPELRPAGDDNRPCLLIHAVSVGEVNAIRLLVKTLDEKTASGWRIVISTTTDTGTARARELFEPQHRVVRYPLDFTRSVRRFLDTIRPDLVALTELEVWPNFVRLSDARSIPVCVINGRLTERSYKRYRIIAPLLRGTFARLTFAAVQTQAYAERFIGLGTLPKCVEVFDTMKWDTAQVLADSVEPITAVPGAADLAREMGIDTTGQRPIIVAGSTAPGEDKLLIDTCPPDAQLVIVPRKPEWFDQVMQHAPDAVRRTTHRTGARSIDTQRIFLLDTIGELRKAYALADVIIVGRSFLGLFGSDMMEPIALGKPTIIGPHHKDFADIMAALTAADGIIVTDQPGRVAVELLADRGKAAALAQRGRRVILSRQGATQRHAEMLMRVMPKWSQGGHKL